MKHIEFKPNPKKNKNPTSQSEPKAHLNIKIHQAHLMLSMPNMKLYISSKLFQNMKIAFQPQKFSKIKL